MKIKLIFLMSILFYPAIVFSFQSFITNNLYQKVQIHQKKELTRLKKIMRLKRPEFPRYFHILNKNESTETTGDTLKFFTLNYKNGISIGYDTVLAILKRSGEKSNIWVEKKEIDNHHINDSFLDEFLTVLEDSTGEDSNAPSLGIIDIEKKYFGEIIDSDDNKKIDFLLLDIRDDYDSLTMGNFQAGYFSEVDQRDTVYSNRKDLIYLDTYPALNVGGKEGVFKTAAQLVQMFIHYYYDNDEYPFIRTGTSLYAQTICGFGIEDPSAFLNNTDKNLTIFWDNADFSKCQLFILYLAEQLGDEFIKRLIANPLNGLESIRDILSTYEEYSITLEEIFRNWAIANYLNDVSVSPEYGYRLKEAKSIKANVAYNHFLYPVYRKGETIGVFPLSRGWAFEYSRFTFGDTLTLKYYASQGSKSIRAILMEFGKNYKNVEEISFSQEYTIPGFGNKVDEVVIAIINCSYNQASYSYSATVKREKGFIQVKNDDGKPATIKYNNVETNALCWGVHHAGAGWAVRFEDFDDNLILAGIRIYLSSIGDTLSFNIWLDLDNDGLPDKTVFASPLLVIPPVTTGEWFDIDLTQYENKLKYLYMYHYFFAGVLHKNDADNTYFAIDSNNVNNSCSFARIKSSENQFMWVAFNNLSMGDERVPLSSFNLMFRAAFKITGKTDIGNEELICITPCEPVLYQNYPNPFNNSTKIKWYSPENSEVDIEIFNILGQKVKSFKNFPSRKGINYIEWYCYNDYGSPVSSGIYLLRLKFGNIIRTKKIILLK
ncbi:hypothetical protein DRQ09_06130 [candidate division KSB1 bacterium]|nr:MAG: hypothetical protein DRQ09_06130 [candidate division KSB1 bacterium]